MLYKDQILGLSKLRDYKAVIAAHVAEIPAESREPSVACVRVLGAVVRTWWLCGGIWRSGSWVLVVICHGARLSCWFHQAKA